ncbi:MAG: hypothetical protein EBU00_03550 [Alphaproteobacteria bacterium]|nr:hypothetical protein [Alphaproteobacteria bacterium]
MTIGRERHRIFKALLPQRLGVIKISLMTARVQFFLIFFLLQGLRAASRRSASRLPRFIS